MNFTGREVRSSYDPRLSGAKCDVCPLRGKKVVPPGGDMQADMVIVGEAPGLHEEKQGKPFVGYSGQMLNELLKEAGIDRRSLWLTNSMLCRPATPGVQGPKQFDLPTYLAWLRLRNKTEKKRCKASGEEFVEWPSPVDCCRPRLLAELWNLEQRARARRLPNGLVVIPMGNFALKTLAGVQGIMRYRGSPIPVDIGDLIEAANGR